MLAKLRRSKKAISGTIAAVLMFIIMVAAVTSLIAFFVSTNLSQQKQANFESAQAQEQITVTDIRINNSSQKIENITVLNNGPIEVMIRAIYRNVNNATTLLCDPSTPLAPGSSKTIDLTSFALTAQENDLFTAATERGTKSKAVNEIALNIRNYNDYTNSSALSIGPLVLTFDSLNWVPVDASGNMIGSWTQTWTIPTGTCSWRLKLTNIDTQERNITINGYSGFSLSRVGSPSTTTWYLKDLQQTANFNQSTYITFLWGSTRTLPVSAGSNQQGANNVFLTFFGNYSDGSGLAQTIPFEAIIVT
jgi:hypothetical protein